MQAFLFTLSRGYLPVYLLHEMKSRKVLLMLSFEESASALTLQLESEMKLLNQDDSFLIFHIR